MVSRSRLDRRLVALAGNSVTLDGCRFTLAHPLIPDTTRARMLRRRYERSERELLRAWMNSDAPVVECGGGIGVIATIVNRRLTRPEHHVVIEANPRHTPLIEAQRKLNAAAFTVLNRAIDYSGQDDVSLSVDDNFIGGRVGARGAHVFSVRTLTLRALLDDLRWQHATLICDIEGTETELVEHDADTLARCFDVIILEAHRKFRDPEQLARMFERLEDIGFARIGNVRTCTPSGTSAQRCRKPEKVLKTRTPTHEH